MRKISSGIIMSATLLGAVGFNYGFRARVIVEAVDEECRPVPDAEVSINLWAGDPDIKGRADNMGRFTGEGRTLGMIAFGARAEGFYGSSYSVDLDRFLPPGVRVRRRYPDYTHRVMIRPIVNPVPMFAYEWRGIVPFDRGDEVGFDFLKADWVAPHGRGEVADVLVRIQMYDEERDAKRGGDISWRFPNPGDGMVRISPEDIHEQSRFKMPRTAPESGYIAEWREWSYACPTEGRMNVVEPSGPPFREGPYFIRIRTKKNGEGQAMRAMYGRIDARSNTSIAWNTAFRRRSATIRFCYYINPDGTRNMEFDPERNLFRDILPIQEHTRFPSEP